MMKNKFIKSTIILLIGGFLTKILGMVLKIILTRNIGTKTLGLYMLIMPTFNLFITLSQGGFPISISNNLHDCANVNSLFGFPIAFQLIFGPKTRQVLRHRCQQDLP